MHVCALKRRQDAREAEVSDESRMALCASALYASTVAREFETGRLTMCAQRVEVTAANRMQTARMTPTHARAHAGVVCVKVN